MLRRYAAEHGYAVYDEYVDDGWSGTTFDRPGFLRMIADIEAKRINLVITKDLSRLGRDYITAGRYTEIYFPSKGVRYIAINDGYDSDGSNTDIVPFKNVMNEMYARDTSKKIRSALAAKMRDGAYIAAFAPYGYQKDPADKNRLIIDTQSGEIVRKIFHMAANGTLPSKIARILNEQRVPPPAVYRCLTHEGLDIGACSRRREWTSATITKMLHNIVYRGHLAQGKTSKISFKSSLTVSNPRDEWIIVPNTHEALIDEETFDLVRRRVMARTCEKKDGFFNLFSGLAKCTDCGRNMSATGSRKKDSPVNLCCGGYKLYGSGECTNHFIDYKVLYEIVLNSLKAQLRILHVERSVILSKVQQQRQQRTRKNGQPTMLVTPEERLRVLDHIIRKLYEDNAAGRLSDARMNALLPQYEQEAGILENQITSLDRTTSAPPPSEQASREALDRLLAQILDIHELATMLLFKLIDRIEISQGQYERTECGRVKRQTVKIFYRFQTEAAVQEIVL